MQLPWPFGSSGTSSAARNDVVVDARPGIDAADFKAQPTQQLTQAEKAEKADVEFAEWIASFQSKPSAPPATTLAEPVAAKAAIEEVSEQKARPDLTPRVYEDGTIDIRPEIMHPQSMNCRQTFDQAFYCQSLGGKFNDLYRYGEFKSCSEQWSAFWFCMRTRTMDSAGKSAQTMEYYQKRDEDRKKLHGSSEDVWDIRTRSVKRAFWKNPDELEKQDYQD